MEKENLFLAYRFLWSSVVAKYLQRASTLNFTGSHGPGASIANNAICVESSGGQVHPPKLVCLVALSLAR